jgi:hypothetical protein
MDTLRISDADREAAVALLSEQYALGRLTREEFDERSDAVWSAKTQGDLAPIFVDLPVRSPGLPAPVERRRVSRRGFPVPIVPLLIVLIVIVAFTHLPFVLLGLLLWCGFARWGWAGRWRGRQRGDVARPWASR